ILHLPTNGPGRYNRIITALQTITCYQNISTKLNITVVAHSKKNIDEAYYAWEQTITRRNERTDRVNLEGRARKDFKRMNEGKSTQGISERDIEKYCKTSNKFCGMNEVHFINLEIDKYITHYKKVNEDLSPGKPAFL
uniref:hypothetical protein n=1 Tax=Alkalihalobacillus sp. BA299 TaxID=2815938 RepID=UPI001ADA62C3